jgi:hypothetical protein
MQMEKKALNQPEHIKTIVLRVLVDLAKGSVDHDNFHSNLVTCGPLTGPVPGLAGRGMIRETRHAPDQLLKI